MGHGRAACAGNETRKIVPKKEVYDARVAAAGNGSRLACDCTGCGRWRPLGHPSRAINAAASLARRWPSLNNSLYGARATALASIRVAARAAKCAELLRSLVADKVDAEGTV